MQQLRMIAYCKLFARTEQNTIAVVIVHKILQNRLYYLFSLFAKISRLWYFIYIENMSKNDFKYFHSPSMHEEKHA